MFDSEDHDTPTEMVSDLPHSSATCKFEFEYCLAEDVATKLLVLDPAHAILMCVMDPSECFNGDNDDSFICDGVLEEFIEEMLASLEGGGKWQWINARESHHRNNGWSLTPIYVLDHRPRRPVSQKRLEDAASFWLEVQLVPKTII